MFTTVCGGTIYRLMGYDQYARIFPLHFYTCLSTKLIVYPYYGPMDDPICVVWISWGWEDDCGWE
jgi:hypothetical protein